MDRLEIRIEPELLARIDEWRRLKGGVTMPSRGFAVRFLLGAGLQSENVPANSAGALADAAGDN